MMQWWDNGEAELSALGKECNYTIVCEFGRNRLWKVRQDLASTMLKATWAESADKAKAQAEAWEDAYAGPNCTTARDSNGRLLSAARATRGTRQRLARSFAAQEKPLRNTGERR